MDHNSKKMREIGAPGRERKNTGRANYWIETKFSDAMRQGRNGNEGTTSFYRFCPYILELKGWYWLLIKHVSSIIDISKLSK